MPPLNVPSHGRTAAGIRHGAARAEARADRALGAASLRLEAGGALSLEPIPRTRMNLGIWVGLVAVGAWAWFAAPTGDPADVRGMMFGQTAVGLSAAALTWVSLGLLGAFRWLGARYALAGFLTLSLALLIAHRTNRQQAERTERQVGASLSAFASMFASDLEAAEHWRIGLDTSPDDPRYLGLIEAQKRWVRSNPEIADVYTMRLTPDGRVVLVVDSETDYDRNGVFTGKRESRTPIGEEYAEPTASMLGALSGVAQVDEEVSIDRWGAWVSACHPLRDPSGIVEGIVGVDFSASRWLAPSIAARQAAASESAVFISLAGAGLLTLALTRRAAAVRGASAAALREQQRELERATAAADRANQAKSRFLANMSHEIRTPLTAIMGFTDVLLEDPSVAASPDRVQTVETIRNAGQHLLMIINDILDLSKIESDRMSIERVETQLAALLQEARRLMLPPARAKGVALAVTLGGPIPAAIVSDPTRLRQILMNLIGNAVKFTDSGSVEVRVRTESRDEDLRLLIDVEDTGVGMSTEQAERLFKAFGQADETVTRRHGGTGLGLTICRRLAGLMGGKVWLSRTEPGRGSCFSVDLPLEPTAEAPWIDTIDGWGVAGAGSAANASVKSLRGRILLAEDGADNQRLIAHHLRRAGATVDIAEHGGAALEKIADAERRGSPYDLLLTDMQMPMMDGYALARTLRSRGSTMPIVALTAHAMAEDRARCSEAGCDDYTTKPINRAELISICAQWIGRSSARPARAA
ncbi:MAG: response regulator [Phycisphaerales bacterium]|nr:response regulator [Phycisphaerales bacterium]